MRRREQRMPIRASAARSGAASETRRINRRRVVAGLALGAVALRAGRAGAQDYPSRTVTIISPFAPGGANDLLARLIAQRLGERLGKAFIVQNQTGGGGNIGATTVARAS